MSCWSNADSRLEYKSPIRSDADLAGVTCSNCLAQSITTSMTYDPTFNQLTSVTDALNHTWSIGYDSRGNATSITDPLTHQVTLGYNLNGQVASFTDAANDTVNFTYDRRLSAT
jgi:YD repeat-containing protein